MTIQTYCGGELVSNTVIPAGEERAFVFGLTARDGYFLTTDTQFLIMLPRLQYTLEDGQTRTVPAQTQATTVMPTMQLDYLDALYQSR